MSDEFCTVVIVRVVRSGCETAFESVLNEAIPQLLKFPGHLGVLMLRPHLGGREYGAVLRFASRHNWDDFQSWSEYQSFLAKLNPFLEEVPHVNAVSGLQAWFDCSDGRQPPIWKMAVVTWIGVCMTVGVVNWVLGPLILNWGWFSTLLFANAVVVVILTWVVMPLLTRVTQGWLTRSSR